MVYCMIFNLKPTHPIAFPSTKLTSFVEYITTKEFIYTF